MKLIELIYRKPVPDPWSEGDNIPWNDPEFSERMLKEHLSQDHNAASRKKDKIKQHVQWIHDFVLKFKPVKILDLGCGPGLYSNRLAKLGHQCFGIDYSPASTSYAQHTAKTENLECHFLEADIREADFGEAFDVVMLIFGELNIFKPCDVKLILNKAWKSLNPGGIIILEPLTYECVHDWGNRTSSWYTSESGLFHPSDHIVMEEFFWEPEKKIATNRYYIVDPAIDEVVMHAQSIQAYTKKDYKTLLENCSYSNIRFYPSLKGDVDPEQKDLLTILSNKQSV